MAFLLAQDPLEQGSLAQQMKRFGAKLPERFIDPPELIPGLALYMEAFYELDSERKFQEVLQPIKLSAIVEYAKTFGFTQEQTEDLIFLIRKMDKEHLERLKKK